MTKSVLVSYVLLLSLVCPIGTYNYFKQFYDQSPDSSAFMAIPVIVIACDNNFIIQVSIIIRLTSCNTCKPEC